MMGHLDHSATATAAGGKRASGKRLRVPPSHDGDDEAWPRPPEQEWRMWAPGQDRWWPATGAAAPLEPAPGDVRRAPGSFAEARPGR